MTSNKEVV
jgi:hypothetical protein